MFSLNRPTLEKKFFFTEQTFHFIEMSFHRLDISIDKRLKSQRFKGVFLSNKPLFEFFRPHNGSEQGKNGKNSKILIFWWILTFFGFQCFLKHTNIRKCKIHHLITFDNEYNVESRNKTIMWSVIKENFAVFTVCYEF